MSSTNKKGAGLILSLLTAVAGAVGLGFCMSDGSPQARYFDKTIDAVGNVCCPLHSLILYIRPWDGVQTVTQLLADQLPDLVPVSIQAQNAIVFCRLCLGCRINGCCRVGGVAFAYAANRNAGRSSRSTALYIGKPALGVSNGTYSRVAGAVGGIFHAVQPLVSPNQRVGVSISGLPLVRLDGLAAIFADVKLVTRHGFTPWSLPSLCAWRAFLLPPCPSLRGTAVPPPPRRAEHCPAQAARQSDRRPSRAPRRYMRPL